MKKRPLVTLDFETYYESSGYTLKKLTVIEYVTHEKFHIHGVGVVSPDLFTRLWFTDMNEFRMWLLKTGEDIELLCQNTMFDGFILHHWFNYHPAVYRDTQGMSMGMFVGQSASLANLAKRLFPNDNTKRKGNELVQTINKRHLTPEELDGLGGYCLNDCDLTLDCYQVMEPHYPDKELELIDLTLQFFCDPILHIDVELTQDTLEKATAKRAALIKASGLPEKLLSSNPQFQAWIEEQGIPTPMKVSLTTGEETLAGGKNDLEFQQMRKAHPDLEHVWAGRVAAKSTGEISRAQRFLATAELTGGYMPVPLKYYAAHTGRYGGSEKLNLQNLGRKSALRRALIAPPDKMVFVADSSNIEARMNNWEAGQHDVVQLFRDGADVYSIFAGEAIYHRPISKKNDPTERFVGKVAVLGLGYGMGALKFQTTLATGAMGEEVMIEFSESQRIVQQYRAKHYRIKQRWDQGDLALAKMLDPACDEEWGAVHLLHNMILLPNGMALQYPGLKATQDPRDDSLSFEYWNGKYWKSTWGGTIRENCIAEGTQVITDRGPVNIENIRLADKIWDGVEWVTHGGLLPKGEQPTINAHGVRMTPDHQVLTDDGWKPAEESTRHRRADCKLPEGFELPQSKQPESKLEHTMSGMRQSIPDARHRIHEAAQKERPQFLRVHAGPTAGRREPQARNARPSSLRSLAKYARQMQSTVSSGLQKLRSAWDNRLSALGELRELLGRYGPYVSAGLNPRPERQQFRVPARQLPLGFTQAASEQSPNHTDPRATSSIRGGQSPRHWSDHDRLSTEARLASEHDSHNAEPKEQVFDILNCGPRHRFVVLDENGQPLIVHNCIQALARIVLFEQMLDVNKYAKEHDPEARVVLNVHDEIITVARDFGSENEAFMEGIYDILRTPLDWCKDLPLDAEGGWDRSYSK